jgi:hypothetical protein
MLQGQPAGAPPKHAVGPGHAGRRPLRALRVRGGPAPRALLRRRPSGAHRGSHTPQHLLTLREAWLFESAQPRPGRSLLERFQWPGWQQGLGQQGVLLRLPPSPPHPAATTAALKVSSEGHVLGNLGVMDTRPRSFPAGALHACILTASMHASTTGWLLLRSIRRRAASQAP